MPLTFLILLLAFGAFVAAGVPVLLAFSAVLASIGLSSLVSHVAHASDADELGDPADRHGGRRRLLALLREARARGAGGGTRRPRGACTGRRPRRARRCSSPARPCSSRWPACSSPAPAVFTSLGIGAMIVVFVSMIGSLTVLPALLAKLGDRIDRGVVAVAAAGDRARASPRAALDRAPADAAHAAAAAEGLAAPSRASGPRSCGRRCAFRRRPRRSSTAFLVVLALPAFGMHTKLLGFNDLPRKLQIVQTYGTIQQAFPGLAVAGHGRRPGAGRRRAEGAGGARGPASPRARVRRR